ncbi:MAG TPA: hypothetical protein VN371_06705 [Chlorobaculum sp.]|nr:hypothetical protein [Chlorobaculum sp.]
MIVSIAISVIFGGVSFAADKAPDARQEITGEAKAGAAADGKSGAVNGKRQYKPMTISKGVATKKQTDEQPAENKKKKGAGKTAAADDWRGDK